MDRNRKRGIRWWESRSQQEATYIWACCMPGNVRWRGRRGNWGWGVGKVRHEESRLGVSDQKDRNHSQLGEKERNWGPERCHTGSDQAKRRHTHNLSCKWNELQHRPQPHKISMSEISAKMSEICYQIRHVYICASKLLDEALLVSHFFSMKTLAVTKPISTCTQGVTASLTQLV